MPSAIPSLWSGWGKPRRNARGYPRLQKAKQKYRQRQNRHPSNPGIMTRSCFASGRNLQTKGEWGNIPRMTARGMRCLWGYNARRDDFQGGIEKMMHETVFHAPWGTVCPEKGILD